MINNNNKKIVNLTFKTHRLSNTIHHSLLFSLINNRFIKGYPHKGLNWGIEYRVYHGNYILFRIHGYLDNRGVEFGIYKVKIDDAGYEIQEKLFEDTIILKDIINYVENNSNTPKILKDFIDSLPMYYHGIGHIPPVERYEETIEDVIKFLNEYISDTAEK